MMKKLLVATFALAFVVCLGSVAIAEEAVLSVSDCAKCHSEQPSQIATLGASHQTEIDCQSCHGGHRPSSVENIPACSDCHEPHSQDLRAPGNGVCLQCHLGEKYSTTQLDCILECHAKSCSRFTKTKKLTLFQKKLSPPETGNEPQAGMNQMLS